jgi:preprotein translocase subunit Sec61beta
MKALGFILHLLICSVGLCSLGASAWAEPALEERIRHLYQEFRQTLSSEQTLPSFDHFRSGALAFCKAKESRAEGLTPATRLALVDYSESSAKKRLYLLDFSARRLVSQTYATHAGASAGWLHFYEEDETNSIPYPRRRILHFGDLSESRFFSARPGSRESSLGLALADSVTYASSLWGDPALRMNGLDGALNSSLKNRGVVFHSFNYADEQVVQMHMAPVSEGCLMFPGLDETRKWVEALKGALVLLFHERLVSSDLNQKIFNEDQETYGVLRNRMRIRLESMAQDLGWDSRTLQEKIQHYESKLKSNWLDRATETYELSRQGSQYIGTPLKEEANCFPE